MLTSLLIELTPGPNMTYLALVGVQAGRRDGYKAVAGVALGLTVVGLATALGLAAVITASPLLYAAMRWGGIGYLIYLAWEAWRDDLTAADLPIQGKSRFFVRGLVTNLLNPKAAVFYIAILPNFLDPASPLAGQAVTLSAIYVLVATAIHTLIVTLASLLRPLLANRRIMAVTRKFFAVALLGVAAWVAWSTR